LTAARADLVAKVRSLIPSGDVDENQVAANELAWTYARVEAAAACDDWAQATGDPTARAVAGAAIIEALEQLGMRTTLSTIGRADHLEWIAHNPPPAELGAAPEQRMLRATFRDFARARIAPRAAAINRDDLDIPEDIIQGLAELGVFGLSIREAFGGFGGVSADLWTLYVSTVKRAIIWLYA